MEQSQSTHEKDKPSPLGQLRYEVIEAQTDRLFPWADEMAGNDYIISADDAKTVVEATLQEINNKALFIDTLDYERTEATVEAIMNHISANDREITLTGAVDTTLAICAHSHLIEKPKAKEA
jgi:hypothetical protein